MDVRLACRLFNFGLGDLALAAEADVVAEGSGVERRLRN